MINKIFYYKLSSTPLEYILDIEFIIQKAMKESGLNFKNLDGFKSSCLIAKKMGFGGKACIHPDQIDISNKIFS